MAENIGDLSITIRVNRQTGELDVLKGQVVDAGKAIEGLGQSSAGSSEQLTGFANSITKLASAAAVLAFLKTAIQEAAAEQEAMRHLKAQMDALGLSFDANRTRIEQWTDAMVQLAHIEDDVVVDALSKVIQRTGDLSASMKIVQLSQDIAMATGRDFSLTLENLSVAAGGSSRGLAQLQVQFGQQIAGARTAKEAIQMLANNYGGAAEKAKSLAVSITDANISLKDMYTKVGNDLTPALQFLADDVMKPLVGKFLEMQITVKTIAATLIATVVGVTTTIWSSVKSVGAVISAFYRDDWKGFENAIKTGFTDIKTTAKEQLGIVRGVMVQGGKESAAVWKKSGAEIKEALEDLNSIPVGPGKQETQAVIEDMNRRLEELRRQEAIELADKMLTSDEKIAILESYALREIEIVTETKQKIGEEETKAAEKIAAINDAVALKKKQLEQEGLTNWRQGVTEWGRHIVDTNARVADVGKSTFDGLANSFGQATAKMLMSGKGFAQTFESLFKNLASQVIAQLTAMLVKAAILNTVTGGTGSAFGIKFFAEGGRVYNPTYALIGEGGEPESVVPDSKAQDFARGVLAGKGSGSRSTASPMPVAVRHESQGAGGAKRSAVAPAETAGGRQAAAPAQGITVNMGGISGITINVNGNAGVNGGNVSDLASAIVQGLNTESAKYIELALTLDNVAERYRGRGV